MKLKSLGILMLGLLLAVALSAALLLTTLARQFDTSLQTTKAAYAEVVLPLRQIDANTKNLRFHLLAAFAHDPSGRTAALHAHPLSAHSGAIRTAIDANQRLWDGVMQTAADYPGIDLAVLHQAYQAYYAKGVTPAVAAVDAQQWMAIVQTLSATLFE